MVTDDIDVIDDIMERNDNLTDKLQLLEWDHLDKRINSEPSNLAWVCFRIRN